MEVVFPKFLFIKASRGNALALDGTARFLATRLTDAEFGCGMAAMLCLPQTAAAAKQCASGELDNPLTGEHAYVCPRDDARQQQASKGQIALGVVIASLSALKIVGKPIRGMNRRPLEPTFQYGADYAGLVPVEGAGGRDRLDGGGDDDQVVGGFDEDALLGGAGDDVLFAVDGRRDVVDCGPGQDRAEVDPSDVVRGCETADRG